uniref:Bm1140 n=1 Tax=Brugia malayi TaxID=6279 RepID=A0A1I9GE23_BRUMA|nr:Bm1140 [Brugia malayi]
MLNRNRINIIIGDSLHNIQICCHARRFWGFRGNKNSESGRGSSLVLNGRIKWKFSRSASFKELIKDANSISDDLVAAQKQLASISGCIATSHNELHTHVNSFLLEMAVFILES